MRFCVGLDSLKNYFCMLILYQHIWRMSSWNLMHFTDGWADSSRGVRAAAEFMLQKGRARARGRAAAFSAGACGKALAFVLSILWRRRPLRDVASLLPSLPSHLICLLFDKRKSQCDSLTKRDIWPEIHTEVSQAWETAAAASRRCAHQAIWGSATRWALRLPVAAANPEPETASLWCRKVINRFVCSARPHHLAARGLCALLPHLTFAGRTLFDKLARILRCWQTSRDAFELILQSKNVFGLFSSLMAKWEF